MQVYFLFCSICVATVVSVQCRKRDILKVHDAINSRFFFSRTSFLGLEESSVEEYSMSRDSVRINRILSIRIPRQRIGCKLNVFTDG